MPDWQTSALLTFQGHSGLSRVTLGKVSREAPQRLRRGGLERGDRRGEIVLTQQKVPLKFLSARLQRGSGETGHECQ